MPGRLNRIAVVVDDLDAVIDRLGAALGLEFVVLEVDDMGIRVAIGESGLELVEKTTDARVPVEAVWRGSIASLEVQVDDIDETVDAMHRLGHEVHHSLVTPGGVPKVQMGDIHGLPTLLYHLPDGTPYVEAVTGRSTTGGRYEGYAPDVDWTSRS